MLYGCGRTGRSESVRGLDIRGLDSSDGASQPFIIEQRCSTKDVQLFESVMRTMISYLKQSDDVTFLSDGERRYGNKFFTLCAEALQEGQRGHPPQVLPEGMKVHLKNSLKNKGAQKSKPGRKHLKYEAPHREHTKTAQDPGSSDIHANHVEAQNAAIR